MFWQRARVPECQSARKREKMAEYRGIPKNETVSWTVHQTNSGKLVFIMKSAFFAK